MPRDDAQHLWTVCSKALSHQIGDNAWSLWFEPVSPRHIEDDILVLAVPSPIHKQRLDSEYAASLRGALDEVGGNDLTVSIVVDTTLTVEERTDEDPPSGAAAGSVSRRANGDGAPAVVPHAPEGDTLNPKYTFDAFVIGASNRFAHAAALAVAETPARSYNPLFIYGGAGLGKTHLLHATGDYVSRHYPGFRVRYVATETMLNEFYDAIRTNATAVFKKSYRDCDLLLIDDIQFIEGKERLQEEFFHTFNHLHGADRQIVLTSDRPPDNIPTLEDRLRSRFKWGLITDIQPPDFETRIAILRNKAERESSVVDGEVLELIAEYVRDNIRELEGTLNRVVAYGSIHRVPITRELAEEVLRDVIKDPADLSRPITPAFILSHTADTFGFSVDELVGKSRRRPLVTARQICMYVVRHLTDYSYPAIGREFGNRDHTTVMHACDKVQSQMKEKKAIYDQVIALIDQIKQQAKGLP